MAERRSASVNQIPKHLEKMLFVNYREEEKLQRHLQSLRNSSRMRGMELDREKIQVHNEMRLNRRRNSAPTIVASPALSPNTKQSSGPSAKLLSPETVTASGRASLLDPVNEYLLAEFRRVSEVIPSILNSLKSDTRRGGEKAVGSRKEGTREKRRATVADIGSTLDSVTSLSKLRLDSTELPAHDSGRLIKSRTEPNIGHILELISTVRSLREEMASSKKGDHSHSKKSFQDILKTIQDQKSSGSESDTYTDGACVLLRRKMHKARRASCPVILEDSSTSGVDSTDPEKTTSLVRSGSEPRFRKQFPTMPLLIAAQPSGATLRQPTMSRSVTLLGRMGRQGSRDSERTMRALLMEEDRQLTELKVATELQRYHKIQGRIGDFLEDVTQGQMSSSLPVLPRLVGKDHQTT